MSLYAIEGDVGGGKSFCAVNFLMADYIRGTTRPIYTNLPIDGDQLDYYLAWLTRSPVLREQYRARIHFLRSGEREAFKTVWVDGGGVEVPWPETPDQVSQYQAAGYREKKVSLGIKDPVREFWFFTEPNSVIFLDELADIYNALKRDDRPESLQSYINHHRHYLDDLYFFMQSRDDIDVQVRRKLRYVYYVENMKTKPMFDHWAFRGLRWPIQHFRVRMFAARKVMGKGGDFDRFEALQTFRVWPTRRKFKNYRSFSAAASLPGKALPAVGARSTDMDTWWDRVRDFVANAWAPLGVLTAMVVFGVLALRFIYALAGVTSADVNSHLYGDKPQSTNETKTASVQMAGSAVGVGSTNVAGLSDTNSAAGTNTVAVERLVLRTPSMLKTTARTIRVGDAFAGGVVKRFLLNGVELESGDQYILF